MTVWTWTYMQTSIPIFSRNYPPIMSTETLFQLPLGEESHEVLLLEVESQKTDDQSAFLGFLDTSASHFNKLQALLQLYVFVPVVDNLIEIFDLCVSVNS